MLHSLRNNQDTSFYNFFEDLPQWEVGEIIVEGVELKQDPHTFFKETDLTLPLKT